MINWKLRIQNKATLTSLVICAITIGYTVLGMLGVTIPISEDQSTNIALLIVDVLLGLGIVVDPTTYGIGDSALALSRENIAVTKEGNQNG